jgi:hypothetical protein
MKMTITTEKMAAVLDREIYDYELPEGVDAMADLIADFLAVKLAPAGQRPVAFNYTIEVDYDAEEAA